MKPQRSLIYLTSSFNFPLFFSTTNSPQHFFLHTEPISPSLSLYLSLKMENVDPNTNTVSSSRVQHVAKASSDQLLRKFAEVDSDSKPKNPAKDLRLAKRVKRNQEKSSVSSLALAEGNSLLPPRKKAALMRRLGISRAKIKAREIKNKSIITVIEKVRTPKISLSL